ncbi:hypothetical protein CWI42_091220 [Ordospora colligata]|uniref:Uncharacterized protein n=1 Tax=Ordospora colligata OC4 TaxID=1354746 RepID=A0A0B2UDR4_9MICR|nr:uncharacterized protein M896_091240 [Ordospora colligata OC4]KHN69196.1 hypothetical protein M896_091240 [Ordospora colligata OC4]TBU14474.1 hypothetical protein CWI40_091200 [Ordospora colligata]TBU14651.1 hypothetical protein CWI41_091230 [Ordospora colligata]TBU18036.1 hypothetical protein CWI42_091220 [Ordospora colligata]
MHVRYRLALYKKTGSINDTVLEKFIYDLIREFGGSDLRSKVDVKCHNNVVKIEVDDGAFLDVHGALFFCGEYGPVGCRFERID